MQITPVCSTGILVRRYKRFLADIDTGSDVLTVHCPNTGRMVGCSEPGSKVWYSDSNNLKRKYRHTLEMVSTSNGLVGINTMRANPLFSEAFHEGRIEELGGYTELRSEPQTLDGSGRFDFLLCNDNESCFVEVKNVTLGYGGGLGAFPDAVSIRALRHVNQLAAARASGYRAVLFFCVQHSGVRTVILADEIDSSYGEAVRSAVENGVEVIAYGCSMNPAQIAVRERLMVDFSPRARS